MQGENEGSIDDGANGSFDVGGGNSGGEVVVRVLVDGDREDTEKAPTPDEGKNQTGPQDEKETSAPKAGKSKRKRPANRCAHMQYLRMLPFSSRNGAFCVLDQRFLLEGKQPAWENRYSPWCMGWGRA